MRGIEGAMMLVVFTLGVLTIDFGFDLRTRCLEASILLSRCFYSVFCKHWYARADRVLKCHDRAL